MSASKKTSKFYAEPHPGGVMETLIETLPDERPITDIAVVEHANKCPAGFWPIMKTYDEDSDADLWRQSIMFKKTCRYLCLSKSEVSEFSSGMAVSAIRVVASSDPPPRGYSYASLTHDTGARAWRKRKLCFLLSKINDGVQGGIQTPPITDIILCSRLKKAPEGFQYAGEISGMVLCFKIGGSSNGPSPVHSAAIMASPRVPRDLNKVNGKDSNYENVVSDNNKRMLRAPPERPPKTSALVAELNNLNLHQNGSPSPGKANQQHSVDTSNDYEELSYSYSVQPSKPARPAPLPPRPAPRLPSYSKPQTLGSWCGIDGVPFQLNSRLSGFSQSHMAQLPVIRKKSKFIIDQEYMYSFRIERQT